MKDYTKHIFTQRYGIVQVHALVRVNVVIVLLYISLMFCRASPRAQHAVIGVSLGYAYTVYMILVHTQLNKYVPSIV